MVANLFVFLVYLFLSVAIAMIFTAAYAVLYVGERLGSALLLVFIIIFFGTWLGGMAVGTVGPLVWGIPLFSFLLTGLISTLAITALLPPRPARRVGELRDRLQRRANLFRGLNLVIWILIVALVVLVIVARR